MDISKSYDFFKPEMLKGRIHIIGCGAIGSTVAEMLTRFGITKITLWDFDDVEAKNIANQMFTSDDIGKKKVDAVAEFLRKINPDMGDDLVLKPDGWNGQALSGYIFLCVDNIDLRRKIAESCKGNPYVRALFDFRMRLTDAQHYAADWSNQKAVQAFLDSMAFTHEEAKDSTPVSACNIVLSVCTTVRQIVAAGVSNFINFVKGEGIKSVILTDAFGFMLDAF